MVSQIECQGTWTTTAWSTTPSIYLQAETHTAKNATFMRSLIETIRF